MAQEAKGIRYQLQLAAEAKASWKRRMLENSKHGSEEGRQQCRPPTQQNEKKTAEKQAETVTIVQPLQHHYCST